METVNFLSAALTIASRRIAAALLLITITLGLALAETQDDQGL